MHIRRIALPAAAATGLVALTVAPASAHVTVTPTSTAAGSYTVLTFAAGHGCEGSPTTRFRIAMPESIPAVTPTRHPLWEVEKVVERLDEPVTDAHGNEITERVSEVVYTADEPLPDGYRDAVELSVQLPDAEGETLAFPVVQECTKGENPWTQVPAEGQDADELEYPAPTLTVTAADEGNHGAETATMEEDTDSDGADAADAAEDDGSGDGLAVAGLVAGLAGVVVGGVALARSGRKA